MKERKGKRICKCECGGQVRGIYDFGRWWTWCEKCTPVVVFKAETALTPRQTDDADQKTSR